MKKLNLLVIGAGATGGYYGGRLLEASVAEVRFLVRNQARVQTLTQAGLKIISPKGNVHLKQVQAVLAEEEIANCQTSPAELILLSCKAYDLDDVVRTIAPIMKLNKKA